MIIEDVQNSTEYMQSYIQEVFNIVIEMYKEVAPELISSALHISRDEVADLNSKDIMEKLNNLSINYEVVSQKDDERIWYHDTIKQKMIAQLTGRSMNEEPDELRLHLNELEVLEKDSVEDIKKMRCRNGMSKIISDINYISHEMAHAFEHLISVQNPSYVDSMARLFTDSPKDKIDYDIGESFAISMERLILDRLKQEGGLEKYNLNQYATLEDVEDVWDKKRIIPFSRKEIVGTTSKGEAITILGLDLIPYEIIRNDGMENMVKYIKRVNLVSVYDGIPNKDDKGGITKFCDGIEEEVYKHLRIAEKEEYKPVFSKQQILGLINKIMPSTNGVRQKGTNKEKQKGIIKESTLEKSENVYKQKQNQNKLIRSIPLNTEMEQKSQNRISGDMKEVKESIYNEEYNTDEKKEELE